MQTAYTSESNFITTWSYTSYNIYSADWANSVVTVHGCQINIPIHLSKFFPNWNGNAVGISEILICNFYFVDTHHFDCNANGANYACMYRYYYRDGNLHIFILVVTCLLDKEKEIRVRQICIYFYVQISKCCKCMLITDDMNKSLFSWQSLLYCMICNTKRVNGHA